MFKHLLSPLTVRNTTLKNRLSVAPMGSGYGNRQGAHGEFLNSAIEYTIERARGGFGLFFSGCLVADYKVDPCDPSAHFMLHKPDFQKSASRMTELATVHDMKMIQQISFGMGRNSPGTYSCSPTHVFGAPDLYAPELTKDQINQKIDCMIEAAQLMKACGFVGVEIHAMHWGYLLDNFAMAITNQRKDEYGGSLENRLRISKELVQGIKQVCGDNFLVDMRLGMKSYLRDFDHADLTGEHEVGRTLEEAIEIAKLLEQYGYDMLNVDVGVYESFYHACPPGHMPLGNALPLAAQLKKAVNIPVLCGSRMNDPYLSEKAIAAGEIDGAVLGRPSLADPYYPKKLEMGRPEKIRPCIGCLVGCMGKLRSGQFMGCAVNPALMHEADYGITPALQRKQVAVIGGGISGMEAARICKLRGHDVTIYEKSDRLGGLLHAASTPSFKTDLKLLMDWYIREIADTNIPVVYNTEVTAENLLAMPEGERPDAVILAMGSGPLMPKSIEGIDHEKCVSFIDAHLRESDFADDQSIVVVGGGLVGCETALSFAQSGKKVTIVEAAPEILGASKMLPIMVKQMIPDMLEAAGATCVPGFQISKVNDQGAVIVPSQGGEPVLLPADHVIIAIGRKRAPSFAPDLYGSGIEVHAIGDMEEVGNVYTCVTAAYEVARSI